MYESVNFFINNQALVNVLFFFLEKFRKRKLESALQVFYIFAFKHIYTYIYTQIKM